jgi:hypothetical protein
MESLREEQEVIYQQVKKGPLPEGVADHADGGLQEQPPELRQPPQMVPESRIPAGSRAIPIPPTHEIPPLPPIMPPPPPSSSALISWLRSQRAVKTSSQRWRSETQLQRESLRKKAEQQRPLLPPWASSGQPAKASSISKSPPLSTFSLDDRPSHPIPSPTAFSDADTAIISCYFSLFFIPAYRPPVDCQSIVRTAYHGIFTGG